MTKKITVAIEIADTGCVKTLVEALKNLPGVETVQWFAGTGEKGSLAVKESPEVIIIDDQRETSFSVTERISKLHQAFPQAAIFVVSADTRPEHIVAMMRAGASQFLVDPINPNALTNAIEEIRVRLATSEKAAKGTVYSFISSKGGLGTTVITVNTAVALARNRTSKVALCDMSLQSGDASVLLDLLPATTITDLSRNFHRLDHSFLRGAMCPHHSGLAFLSAPADPEDSGEVSPEQIARILDLSRQLFDVVLVDCASMWVADRTLEIFNLSDKIFVVTDLSVPAVRNAARLCKLIAKLGIEQKRIEVVVNRYHKSGALSIEEVEKTLKKTIYWLFPNDFVDIVSSINQGEPIVEKQPGAPFAKNIIEFAEKLGNPRADASYRGIRGAFGKAI
jgi:pilus assembly protein CpaE